MKEKIKLIILIIVFVVLLITVKNLLANNKELISNNNFMENDETEIQEITEIPENKVDENKNNSNVTTSVISAFDKNQVGTFYTDVKDEFLDITEEKDSVILEVDEINFEKEVLQADKKVLIDFYADWCEPCKELSPIMETIAIENPDVKVVKINVDLNTNLASKYGANYLPTIVVFENGKEINRSIGVKPKEEILKLIK